MAINCTVNICFPVNPFGANTSNCVYFSMKNDLIFLVILFHYELLENKKNDPEDEG